MLLAPQQVKSFLRVWGVLFAITTPVWKAVEELILLVIICPSQVPRKLQLKYYGSIPRKKSEMETSK